MIGAIAPESSATGHVAPGREGGYPSAPLPATRMAQVLSESQCLVVLCTAPDDAVAESLARTLVAERLAACVNRLPGLVSNYRWEGRVEEDAEVLLLVKSTAEQLDALCARITALHPYELPEILAVPVLGGLDTYLAWVRESVAGPSSS